MVRSDQHRGPRPRIDLPLVGHHGQALDGRARRDGQGGDRGDGRHRRLRTVDREQDAHAGPPCPGLIVALGEIRVRGRSGPVGGTQPVRSARPEVTSGPV